MVFSIAKLSPLWLEIQAPLDVAAGLREGAAIKLANGEGSENISGKLIAIGRAVDAASQTVLLRAEVGKGAEKLTPGQAVAVELPGKAAAGLKLPAAALIRHEGQSYAFVRTASNEQGQQFVARPVRVLAQGGDGVSVEGVQPGEAVAVKGVSGLKAMFTGVGKE